MSNNAVFQSLVEYPLIVSRPNNEVYQSIAETARPANQYLSVSGALGNNRIDRRVISLKRYASLCNPPQRGTLILDTSFPRTTINPGESLVLFERGTRVLTGYVTKVTRSRPSYDWIIDFEDTYTRVINYFISDDELVFKTATSMKYLIKTILDLTGITYRIGGPDFAVAPGANLSLRTAHDALTEVLAYGGLYAWVDPDGTLRLRRAPGKKFRQYVTNPISTQEMISTEQTRNAVFVYGGTMTGLPANSLIIPPQVNLVEQKEIKGLITDLRTVVANPLITTYADAERLATGLLGEMGKITDILSFEVEGNPVLHIGTSGSFYHQHSDGMISSGSGPITSMETVIDDNGYKMTVTIGERCPRIAGWTQPPNQMRALWIACRGGPFDPRPEKLIWTGDFGLGGQPTYNIVKTLPPGNIQGMHVDRAGCRVYLNMRRTTSGDDSSEIWYSDNPYFEDVEWTRLIGSGDLIGDSHFGGNYNVDYCFFGTNAITSMMMIGTTFCFVFRGVRKDVFPWRYRHFWRAYDFYGRQIDGGGFLYDQAWVPSATAAFRRGAQASDSDPYIVFNGLGRGGSTILWETLGAISFNNTLINGVSLGSGTRNVGSWWQADNGPQHLLYAGFSDRTIYDEGTVTFTGAIGTLPKEYLKIRGDYWGTQYQFVDNNGQLFIGQIGGAPSPVFQWKTAIGSGDSMCGVVLCIDKKDPKHLAWIPYSNDNANEVARESEDGGVTWQQRTGNWWGDKGDVLSGSKMQSDGYFQLIDAHPTFYGSEVVPEDGA